MTGATHSSWSGELYAPLSEAGFLDVSKEAEFGPVCAVLLIEEAARSPLSVQVGASALVAALACDVAVEGPVALARVEDLAKPIRYLPVAKTLLVVSGGDLLAVDLSESPIERNSGMYAYPFGSFTKQPDLELARRVGSAERARLFWQIYLAAEEPH